MSLQSAGKHVPAPIVGYKVKVVYLRWLERRLDRSPTRIGDGARRKSNPPVGVVGGVEVQVGLENGASVLARQLRCINHSGITL
jgi:hypothetical protein